MRLSSTRTNEHDLTNDRKGTAMTATSIAQSRLTRSVAVTAAALLIGVAVFQAAVALGAPLGDYVWGGFTQGELSPIFRIASAFAAVSLLWMALVVLARAGMAVPITPAPTHRLKALTWVISGFMVLNTVGNLASQSSSEQLLMAPITALLAVLTALVAARGTTSSG
jgi:hypothetical protein